MRCSCFRARSDSADCPEKPIASQSNEGANSEYDDPRIPLTKKQKFVLTKNWKGISREVTEAGANMFVKMLSEHTEYFNMFAFRSVATCTKEEQLQDETLRSHGEAVMKLIGEAIWMLSEHTEYFNMFAFRSVATCTKEEQLQDETLRSHGEAVMKLIGEAICGIEDGDKFFSILNENGRRHAYKNYFRPEMFWRMEQPFLFAVKLILGDRYTENMDQIYRVVIHLMIEKMEEACKDEFKRKQDNNTMRNGHQ
ncbi:hypothetical protein Tcan_03535 [Toxocara canis]|uniref:Globin domain-containing protein n=1 Tax=Toxocara canis TaxID=6265 RepID=A0A0B2VMK5_TOXCA|nr:hypothetical protein Tcan_03535 [Toxocara canis]